MKKIKEEHAISLIEKRKLEFGNHQFAMCSDIKTKMVWVVIDNKEPLSNFTKVK